MLLKNGGFIPVTLAEIKLPLPLDPATGKPFEYSVDKGIATLHGENLYPGTDVLNRYYEIRHRSVELLACGVFPPLWGQSVSFRISDLPPKRN